MQKARGQVNRMDDLISRQAAIDAIEHRLAEPAYQHTGEDWYVGMNCAESELYELPSAQLLFLLWREDGYVIKDISMPWEREIDEDDDDYIDSLDLDDDDRIEMRRRDFLSQYICDRWETVFDRKNI